MASVVVKSPEHWLVVFAYGSPPSYLVQGCVEFDDRESCGGQGCRGVCPCVAGVGAARKEKGEEAAPSAPGVGDNQETPCLTYSFEAIWVF